MILTSHFWWIEKIKIFPRILYFVINSGNKSIFFQVSSSNYWELLSFSDFCFLTISSLSSFQVPDDGFVTSVCLCLPVWPHYVLVGSVYPGDFNFACFWSGRVIVDFDVGKGLFKGFFEFESRIFEEFTLVTELDINDFGHLKYIKWRKLWYYKYQIFDYSRMIDNSIPDEAVSEFLSSVKKS